MARWGVLRLDDDAQTPFGFIRVIVAMLLVFIGLGLIGLGAWSWGFGFIGVGCIIGGFGGTASFENPLGKVVGGAGLILLIIAFAINQIFHR